MGLAPTLKVGAEQCIRRTECAGAHGIWTVVSGVVDADGNILINL